MSLCPLAAEDGYNRCSAGEEWGGVARVYVFLENRLAIEVGKEEREFGFEETGRGDEGFALVVLQVAPIAEIRS